MSKTQKYDWLALQLLEGKVSSFRLVCQQKKTKTKNRHSMYILEKRAAHVWNKPPNREDETHQYTWKSVLNYLKRRKLETTVLSVTQSESLKCNKNIDLKIHLEFHSSDPLAEKKIPINWNYL